MDLSKCSSAGLVDPEEGGNAENTAKRRNRPQFPIRIPRVCRLLGETPPAAPLNEAN